MIVSTTNHWKLGLFVVLGVGVAFGALVWLGTFGLNRSTYSVVTYFDESVQGLEVGSAIKFRGVPIGVVDAIGIAQDLRHVAVTSEVYVDEIVRLGLRSPGSTSPPGSDPVPEGLRLRLVSIGITGLKFLEADFFDPARYPPPTLPFSPPRNYLPSTASTLKSVEGAVMESLSRLPDLEQQMTDTLAEAENTLATLRNMIDPMSREDAGVASLLEGLQGATASLDVAANHLGTAVREAEVGETSKSIRSAANAVADAAHEATGLQGDLREGVASLLEALESIRNLAETLERDPGAVLRGREMESGPGGPR